MLLVVLADDCTAQRCLKQCITVAPSIFLTSLLIIMVYPVETIVMMATTAAGPRTAPNNIGPATGGVLLSWRPRGAPRHARRTHHRVDLPFCSTRTCVPSYCSFADRSDTDAFIQIVPMKAWFDLGRDIGIGASGLMR